MGSFLIDDSPTTPPVSLVILGFWQIRNLDQDNCWVNNSSYLRSKLKIIIIRDKALIFAVIGNILLKGTLIKRNFHRSR